MAEDLRHRLRFAASLTFCGLLADFGYVMVEAAARFSLDKRWPEAAAYFLLGMWSMFAAFRGASLRVQRELRHGR